MQIAADQWYKRNVHKAKTKSYFKRAADAVKVKRKSPTQKDSASFDYYNRLILSVLISKF